MGIGKYFTMRTYLVLYHSPNLVKVIKSIRLRWTGHGARMEEGNSAFKMLTGKCTGEKPVGWPRRR